MDFSELLNTIFSIVVLPLLAVLTKYLVAWIRVKTDELMQKNDNDLYRKYMGLLEETIIDCVMATNQTYVDALKAEGKFDIEAQKIAFKKTYDAVFQILTEDAKVYLSNALGDLEAFVNNMIEAKVSTTKTING